MFWPRSIVVTAALFVSTCGPYFSSTSISPPSPASVAQRPADPVTDPLSKALQTYVEQTQPYRKLAAQTAEQVPDKDKANVGAEAAVRIRGIALAEALKTKVRPNAKQGDLFGPSATAIKDTLAKAFAGPRRDLLLDALAEQQEAGAKPVNVTIHEQADAPQAPPLLNELLPPTPREVGYDFVGRTLIIRDRDADVVVDYLPNALPERPPAGVPAAPPRPGTGGGVASLLPMPEIRGSTLFAAIGDSGSGDRAQSSVAEAMLAYFTNARRFPFVLMLGDNLYSDDYADEFALPYKPLLDRGVKFYAVLGNHDREAQIHYKPFNMNDREYYSFDRGNVRFAALNSNHPGDPEQAKWVDETFSNAGDKWRIVFFHHPLYSSSEHADEGRKVHRPVLEPVLVRNRINVAFNGHEHVYERVAPQQGVSYFVSGGAGRYLRSVRPSAFDQVAVSAHHFMVVEVAGDTMFFEAITPAQKILDCGVIYRTAEAASKTPDKDTTAWLASCAALRPSPKSTR